MNLSTEHWFIPVAIVAILAIFYGRYIYRPSWEYLRKREPEKKRWIDMYSSNQLPSVEEALDDIKTAFLLRDEDVFRLLPTDLLHDIYKSAYPYKSPDALEFENLAKKLENKGVSRDTLARLTNPSVEDIIKLYVEKNLSGRN